MIGTAQSSIRKKLIAIGMIPGGAAVLITLVIISTGEFVAARRMTRENIVSLARVIGTNCIAPLTFNDPAAAEDTLSALSAEPQIAFARVYTVRGELFSQYLNSNIAASGMPAPTVGSVPVANQTHWRFQNGRLDVWEPVRFEGRTIGALNVAFDLTVFYRRMTGMAFICLGTLVLSFVATFFISKRVQRSISRPIAILSDAMARVSKEKDYGLRVEKQSEDELGILFEGFNGMLSEIQARDETLYFVQFTLDHIGDGVLWVDRNGVIVNVNLSVSNLTGYEREELVSQQVFDFEPTLAADWAVIWEETRKRKSLVVERNVIRKDHVVTPMEMSLNYIEFRGKAYHCAIIRDTTERRRLQKQLEQAQKMEAIGTLAGGVAHDLNNILGSLVGYPDLLLMDLAEDDPMRGTLLAIKRAGERAAAIVEDMLTLARRGVRLSGAVNLNEVVDDYMASPEYARILSDHTGIRVAVEKAENLPNILGSGVHLSKTLMNLVSNAAESMNDGGVVTIRTAECAFHEPMAGFQTIPEGRYVKLSVTDHGTGMSEKDMTRIFEPFYTKKTMGKSGTGLGMTVVSGTVKDHGGFVDLVSREGAGTRFDLYFPVSDSVLDQNAEGAAVSGNLEGRETVLVVDDIKEQREVASSVLRKLGYTVFTVSSGEAALGFFSERKPDLVVLDMVMEPGMDGLETWQEIIKRRPDQKAIIASGHAETVRVREAMALGVSGYVKKPYTVEKLGLAVRHALDAAGTQV